MTPALVAAAVPFGLPVGAGPLAHGVGTRADLPLPVGYVVAGGGLAVLVSFVALGALWRTPRLAGAAAGRPLPRPVAALAHGRPRLVLQAVVLALSVLVVVIALAGSPDVAQNAAPWAFFVTFWVGLVPVSLLLGPVWGALNPLRTTYRLLARVLPAPARPDLAERWGYRPAALSLLAFAWFELAAPDRSDPRRVGAFLVAYALVHLVAAAVVGERWFLRGDGFEAYSRLLGALAPVGRRSDGVLVLRNPLDGAAALPARRGLVAVVVVLVGSTAFDGLGRTQWWQNGFGAGGEAVLPSTTGPLATVALVGLLFAAGAGLAGRLGGYPGAAAPLAHTLVPVAAGYAVAHYFSLLLFDGQTTWILLSDPFATGADLLGLTGRGVDYLLVTARTISLVQVAAIVGGHVVGTVLAHDRALVLSAAAPAARRPVASQVPLLAIMVVLTMTGLGLLLGA
ncbi:hypothetical protein [Kineosporia sp. A_224]|uniref:hypothetical protein n=1 Tax=Kineosporia sp. A_224 TaxID=1962180 RepID=UPI0018E973EE|nr:hypothetical protein [Kineosporia sp. A_224]